MDNNIKIAYLILAYKNPSHLKRLIEALMSNDCAFYIHLDKKSNFTDFEFIKGENIYFCNHRIPVYWGDFSQVKAILIMIQQALNSHENFQYFVFLTGSDYPLRSNKYIHKFFNTYRGFEFISIVKMPSKMTGKTIEKLNTYRVQSNKPILQIIMKIFAKVGLARRNYRKYFGTIEPYSGSGAWALSKEACTYMIDFIRINKKIVKFFENVITSDEIFFQTIIGNSPFKLKIKRNLTYADWSKRGSHPEIITENHIAFFKAQDKIMANDVYGEGELLFARKFPDKRIDLLNRIDEMIKQKEGIQ